MPSSCPKCHGVLEEDEICCAQVRYAWRCKSCFKLTTGFAIPYGKCFMCGGELEVIPGRDLGDSSGWVTGMRCQKMELGEPDASGRRRPVPAVGSEFPLDVDTVIYALGTTANPIIAQTTPGLNVNKWGYIEIDESTRMTSVAGVFAGGDIVTGAATVILAMGAGKQAARAMLEYI